jgi:aspartate 4-decarboxylase
MITENNKLLNDHSEVSDFEREMQKISPFELKDRLIELADESVRRMMRTMLNAGRGNPNWIATVPREAFFALGRFALDECRLDWERSEGIAGIPQKEGIAARFKSFLSIRSKEPVCYEDLGTEAVCRLEVEDFYAIVGIDSLGNSLL